MNASNPTRQVTLIGEASASRDFGQPGLPVANKLYGTLQPQMHDITMRGHTDRSGEHAREVERAAPRYVRECSDLDRLVEMSNDIISEPLEDGFAQFTSCPARDPRGVTSKQIFDEAARDLAPEECPIRVAGSAFQRQGAGKIEEHLVVAR